MPNVMAAQPNIGGALCGSYLIPFLVPRRKVWLKPSTRVPCSNAVKMWNPLKFAGVPQTANSAYSGPKFAILWGHVGRYCCLTTFFQLSIHALVAKIQPDKFVWWCADGDFLRHFCLPVLYFHRAACSRFQTCILNSHCHTVYGNMVDIQSATAAGEEKGKKKPQDENIMACPIDMVKWRHISMVAIRSPFCRSRPSYCA